MKYPVVKRFSVRNAGSKLVLMAVLLAAVVCASVVVCGPVAAQTEEEIDGASKVLGSRQTKAATLAFWAGIAEADKHYDKALAYYKSLKVLDELEFGPLNARVAWTLAKLANCYSRLGESKEAVDAAAHCQELIDGEAAGAEGKEKTYFSDAADLLKNLPDGIKAQTKANKIAVLPRYQSETQAGLDALYEGRFADAVTHLSTGLNLCPPKCEHRALLLRALGSAEERDKQYDAAKAHLTEVIQLAHSKPAAVEAMDLAGSYRVLAEIALDEKDLEQCEAMLANAADIMAKSQSRDADSRILWLAEMVQERHIKRLLLDAQGKHQEALAEVDQIKANMAEREKLLRALSVENTGDNSKAEQKTVAQLEAMKSSPAEPLDNKPHVFQSGSHAYEITPPEKFRVQAVESPFGRMYSFLGPDRQKEGAGIFTVYVIDAAPGQNLPTDKAVLDGLLAPFEKRLAGYSEDKIATIVCGPDKFEGIEFSGAYPNGLKAHGFFATAASHGARFVLCGFDHDQYYQETRPAMVKLAESIRVKN